MTSHTRDQKKRWIDPPGKLTYSERHETRSRND
jgi:hypothetical protein